MKKINISLIFIIFFSLSCARYFKKDIINFKGNVNGKVIYQNQGLSGALIYAYRKDVNAFLLSPDAVSLPSDENGNFSLELEPGVYYMIVRKAKNTAGNILEKGDYFSYFGGNPVRVSKGEKVDFVLNCVKNILSSKEIVYQPNMDKPGVSGVVYHEDKPLQDAEVFFYLNMENDMRGPAYFSVFTDIQGRFYAPLESGAYYIVCRKRMSPEQIGPLRAGDYFGYYEANPVFLKQGENQKILIYVLKKEIQENTSVIITPSGLTNVNQTFISGKVYDLLKNPVNGVYICLYKKNEMVGKPEYISNKTDKDGFFQIDLTFGGKFYLIAKENFGTMPKPNDFIGYLVDSKDHSIEITTNENLTGLEIIGEKILSK